MYFRFFLRYFFGVTGTLLKNTTGARKSARDMLTETATGICHGHFFILGARHRQSQKFHGIPI